MKTRNVILGVTFILIGILLLLQNFGLFTISFDKIAPYWPILWILAGLFAWFDPHKRVMNGATTLLIVLSIPLIFYAQTLKWQSNFTWDQEDLDQEEEFEMNLPKSAYSFEVANDASVTNASFSISSGLGSYGVETSRDKLFAAEVRGKNRQMKMTDGLENGVYQINLSEAKEGSSKVGSSDVKLHFHQRPLWDMKWEIGLGEIDLKLQDLKIRRVELNTGLAEVKLKIGTLQKETHVELKSGLADTEVEIPEQAGAEIRTEAALSSFDFKGFEEVQSGVYRTSNFDSAKQKIFIEVKSGFASVQVNRYN